MLRGNRAKVLATIAVIPRSINEIAAETGLTVTQVGGVVYQLKKKGLVKDNGTRDANNKDQWIKCDDPTVAVIRQGMGGNATARFSKAYEDLLNYVEILEERNKQLTVKLNELEPILRAVNAVGARQSND